MLKNLKTPSDNRRCVEDPFLFQILILKQILCVKEHVAATSGPSSICGEGIEHSPNASQTKTKHNTQSRMLNNEIT